MENAIFALIPLAGMATGAVFLVIAYKLVAKWMDYRHRPAVTSGSDEQLRELGDDLALMQDLPGRVAELEERLDFAERLLAQARNDQAALKPGDH